ncbi:MAG: efflux RND transporter periplasmic adaptor subunit, partial [Fibrobacter sp.]|nr:efflux RND transporter periplasmic adaptor subunit [Fibrobacter sp.]
MNKKAVVNGIFCLTTLVLINGCAAKKETEEVKRVVPVEVYVAKPDSISSYIKLTGGIEAQNDAVVYSKVSEKLISLNVKPGSHVSAGQVLGIQYNQGLLQGKKAAEAGLKSAEINVNTSRDEFTRMQNLYAKSAISKQQFDQVKSRYDIAVASYEQAKAAVEQASVQFENAILRAPFDGTVAAIYFDPNQMIQMGQPVVKMVNAGNIKAKIKVPSTDISKISIGENVVATFPSFPDTEFLGTVYHIDDAIDPQTRTLEVEVRLPNKNNILKSGLFGEFSIETKRSKNSVVVSEMTILSRTMIKTSEKGIQTTHPDFYLFVVEKGKAKRLSVALDLVSDGFIEIANGVSFGDSIIVAGQNIVNDGDSVRVV